MRSKRLAWVSAVSWVLLAVSLWSGPAQAVLPPGYTPILGPIPLNPAHVGAVGSQFNQDCSGLPRPVQPGEVAWHFILPRSVAFDPTPTNIFNTLSVTFQTAGTVNLGTALTDFGPPSSAHAYVYTSTDDTLLAGSSTIGRDLNADAARSNDPQFNLSHTCASQLPPPSTTTTTAATTTTTTTTSSTTTSTTSTSTTTTTISPISVPTSETTTPTTAATTTTLTTTTSSGTSTDPTTSAVLGPATTSAAAPDSTAAIPTTGNDPVPPGAAAIVAVAIGAGLVMLTRRRVS